MVQNPPTSSNTELKEEEQREQARAASVRSQKRLVEESKEMTIEDLTRGIINYKYLGLDFQKAENTNLRCVPRQYFAFVFFVCYVPVVNFQKMFLILPAILQHNNFFF